MEKSIAGLASEYQVTPDFVSDLWILCRGHEPAARRILETHRRTGIPASEALLRDVLRQLQTSGPTPAPRRPVLVRKSKESHGPH